MAALVWTQIFHRRDKRRLKNSSLAAFILASLLFALISPAIDVVELVVRELETDPLFNSGRGSALTENGTVEMEASIMDGPKRRCGAVSGLTTVKNPISLARLVMEKSPHSYLAFSGAEEFARQQGVELVDNGYFITEENVGMLKLAKEANSILFDYRIPAAGLESCSAGSRCRQSPGNERTPDQCLCARNSWVCGGGQRRKVRCRHFDRWAHEQEIRSYWRLTPDWFWDLRL
ncbi:hypothetical protein OIU77_009849 [Salix suchowensis]|uniref:Uncharacterized protein n=1 Tax=Salix suchowensis TaxID=1278906 RepID=A0ABQ9A6Z4_9ROSI|nr:hypothetical protein OIU77_009849 [Salix suchowensis]